MVKHCLTGKLFAAQELLYSSKSVSVGVWPLKVKFGLLRARKNNDREYDSCLKFLCVLFV